MGQRKLGEEMIRLRENWIGILLNYELLLLIFESNVAITIFKGLYL